MQKQVLLPDSTPARPLAGIPSDTRLAALQDALEQPVVLAVLMSLSSLVLYTLTLAPGLLWGGGDFAKFQTWAYLGTVGTEVDVFAHPLWVILAHPFTWLPIRDMAWRANLAAAVFASLALGFVFLSAWHLTRSRVASLLGTSALAVSHTFWTYAVMPKVYSLNTLLLAACVYLLLRWRDTGQDRTLYLCALLYGLSFLNHLVMSTVAAGFTVFIVLGLRSRREPRQQTRTGLLAALAFGVGLAPYLVLMTIQGTAGATGGTALSFLKGLAYPVVHPSALAGALGWGLALGIYQFPVTTLVGLLGLYTLWRRDRQAALLILLAILGTVAFLLSAVDPGAGTVYVWNLHYYLPAYVTFALGIAVGFDVLWNHRSAAIWSRRAALAGLTMVLPVALYAAAPVVARTFWQDVPDFRPLPGRDNLAYALTPWKQGEAGARPLGEQILRAPLPHSVLFADYSLWAIANYLQVVEHARPDVTLVLLPGPGDQVPVIVSYTNTPNLYLADTYRYYNIQGIQQYFDIVPDGPIYRLVPKK